MKRRKVRPGDARKNMVKEYKRCIAAGLLQRAGGIKFCIIQALIEENMADEEK